MELFEALARITNRIWKDEPLNKHTTFRIGGAADILLIPETEEELISAVRLLRQAEMPYFFMGNGSNLLVSDQGYRGVVVKTIGLNKISVQEQSLTAAAGAMMSKTASAAEKHQLSGFEALSGIPGTVGGAVTMNAGAYGSEIRDILLDTRYLDGEEIKILSAEAHQFSYRHSFFFGKPYCILSSRFSLQEGNQEHIRQKTAEYTQLRVSKQPLQYPSAGSTFKRPEGYFAAKLIEDCGLRGKRIGGACVSEKHSGFLLNDRGATCEEMLRLIEFVKEEVLRQTGVELETEIFIVQENWRGVLSCGS